VFTILITDLDELKQRLRTEWPTWIMSSLRQPFVSGVAVVEVQISDACLLRFI